jgi:hypothetical protein
METNKIPQKRLYKNLRFILFGVTISLLILILFTNSTKAEECDFTSLIPKIPLLSQTLNGTEKLKANPETWKTLERVLPNLQYVFLNKEPNFLVLFGWGYSIDDFAEFTPSQIENYYLGFFERGPLKELKKQGAEVHHEMLNDDPLTLVTKLDYLDGGHPYRDIAIDVFATRHCVVSLKISGRTDDIDPQMWAALSDELEFTRKVILDEYGALQFSDTGSRVWYSSFFWVLCLLAILIVLALIASSIYLKVVPFSVGPATKWYSVAIVFFLALYAADTVYLAESDVSVILSRTGFAGYEMLPHTLFVLLAHLVALLSKKARIVAFAIWLVASSLIYRLLAWSVGWDPFRSRDLIFVAIGLCAVMIVLGVSYNRAKREKATYEEAFKNPSKPMWRCMDCDFSAQKDTFSESELFCPKCKGRLELSSS